MHTSTEPTLWRTTSKHADGGEPPNRHRGVEVEPDAYERALGMLERRARTASELRRGLARAGHASVEIDATVDRLGAAGLLDDVAYANHFARTRLAAGRTAPARVREDLVRRGVDRRTAAAAVETVVAEDEVDLAAILDEVASRRAASMARYDDATRRRRLYSYLARRGYESEAIRGALERVLGRP